MKKKIIASLLAGMLVVSSLAGCGSTAADNAAPAPAAEEAA
ncbi:MAG TPA: metal ABC transporter substrate-binding protein, partial [Lachnospiraceae bacterium]|nr:metal ABC transporter substrate-binding protein [Lachnospiraceae bacterium]HCR99847.1 metal ABC transporter substrate-binding protein [Lachnospiraceae bacterium]